MIQYKLHIRNTFRTCFCIVTLESTFCAQTSCRFLQILYTVSCLAPHRTPSTETVRNNNEHRNTFGGPQYAEWRCCSSEVANSPILLPQIAGMVSPYPPFATLMLLLLAAPQDWLLHVAKLPNCCVLPIIAEDGFRFPSPSYYEDAGRGLEHCCSLGQSI